MMQMQIITTMRNMTIINSELDCDPLWMPIYSAVFNIALSLINNVVDGDMIKQLQLVSKLRMKIPIISGNSCSFQATLIQKKISFCLKNQFFSIVIYILMPLNLGNCQFHINFQ